jgi:hypothetical protein
MFINLPSVCRAFSKCGALEYTLTSQHPNHDKRKKRIHPSCENATRHANSNPNPKLTRNCKAHLILH